MEEEEDDIPYILPYIGEGPEEIMINTMKRMTLSQIARRLITLEDQLSEAQSDIMAYDRMG